VKDQRTLLTAFARVRQHTPACRLEILGCGELLDELEAQARALGIHDSVTFRGWSRDVAGFLAGVDAFVLSSRSEGLPMTLLEAMAAGLPVVSTAVGGIPEVVNGAGCGWLAPAGDAVGLADRMLEALNAPDFADRSKRARQAAAANYSVGSMTDQYGRLFERLVGTA
jgi:glycosyltransferase involved in cell wall biosynthesis